MDLPDLFPAGGVGPGAAATLAALALIDSTSFGTLLIPVWLLLAPGPVRPGRVLVYLGTVAGFYLGVGVVLLLGASAFLERYGGLLDTRGAAVAQLVAGAGLFALSFRFDGKRAAARRTAEQAGAAPRGRLTRWRERALGLDGARASLLPIVGLALGATSIEVATMLPYLAAIGIVTASGLPGPLSAAVLTAYCVVMVLPALVLLAGRALAARTVEPVLRRLDGWLSRNAVEMTGWVLGVLGVLLALDALGRLGA